MALWLELEASFEWFRLRLYWISWQRRAPWSYSGTSIGPKTGVDPEFKTHGRVRWYCVPTADAEGSHARGAPRPIIRCPLPTVHKIQSTNPTLRYAATPACTTCRLGHDSLAITSCSWPEVSSGHPHRHEHLSSLNINLLTRATPLLLFSFCSLIIFLVISPAWWFFNYHSLVSPIVLNILQTLDPRHLSSTYLN